MWMKLVLVLLLFLSAPMPLLACLCEVLTPAGEGLPVPVFSEEGIARREAVFVGKVLGLMNPSHSADGKRWPDEPQYVLFLVERGWKGIEQDTVTLEVGRDAPCAFYSRYRRYLVVANRSDGVLRAPPCDTGLTVDQDVARDAISKLGLAGYTPPPRGSRSLDRDVIHAGDPSRPAPDSVWAGFVVPDEIPTEVRIADRFSDLG